MASKKSKVAIEEPEEVEVAEDPEEEEEGENEPYLALTRRFRPMQFADVFGQEQTTAALGKTIVENKIVHAYLFTGPRGTGKTTTARIFAAAINCRNIGADGEPCQKCDSCYGISNGTQGLGVIEYDAASNRSVDGIRSIIEQTRTSSALSKNKVFIIDEVHALTGDAITAFLKTLEEPPPGVIFILCTTNPEKVLPTIRSRTVQFKFNLVTGSVMEDLVQGVCEQAGINITKKQLHSVVSEGKGSPRDTLSVLERISHGGAAEDNSYPSDITRAIAGTSVSDIILTIADAVSNGIDLTAFAFDLLSYWRNCILALQAPALIDVSDELFDEIHEDAAKVKLSRLFRMVLSMSETIGKMSYAGDPRILLETTLIQIILPSVDDRSLMAIHDQLEDLREDVAVIASALRSGSGVASPVWPEVNASETPSRAKEAPSSDDDEPEEKPEPKSKKSKSKKVEPEPEPDDEDGSDDEDDEPIAKNKKSKKIEPEDDEDEPDNDDVKTIDEILQAIIDDAPKRFKLILNDAIVVEKETDGKRFTIETGLVSDKVYDAFETSMIELVGQHAPGRKFKHYEKED